MDALAAGVDESAEQNAEKVNLENPPRKLIALTLFSLVTYGILLFFFPTFQTVFRDIVLNTIVLALATTLVVWRFYKAKTDRISWFLLSLASIVWVISDFFYNLSMISGVTGVEWVDYGYFVSIFLVCVGLTPIIITNLQFVSKKIWLDVFVVALSSASLLILPFIEMVEKADYYNFIPALLASFFNLILLCFLLSFVTLLGKNAGTMLWGMTIGLPILWISDFLWLAAEEGSSHLGSPLDFGWLLGFTILGISTWGTYPRKAPVDDTVWSVTTLAFALASFVLIVCATWWLLPTYSVVLAVMAVLIGAWRGQGVVREAAKHQEERRLAYFDVLSGVPNRRFLISKLSPKVPPGMLIMMDMDGFKNVNDSLGHEAGDLVITTVAHRLDKLCADNNSILSRMGGDEFVVFIPQESNLKVEQLRKKVKEPISVANISITLDASFGTAKSPQDSDDFEKLLYKADLAMYKAKQYHTGIHAHSSEENGHASNTLEQIQLITNALEESKVKYLYQPIVDTERKCVGFESLVRFANGGEFFACNEETMAALEKTSLIHELTESTLKTPMKTMAPFLKNNPGMKIALNVSSSNFNASFFYTMLEQNRIENGLSPETIILEVTETAKIDPKSSLPKKLKEQGYNIAVDDYGVGYSSIEQILLLQPDQIKIDGFFTQDIAKSSRQRSVVAGIVQTAHGLGAKVVAEKVETEEDFLVCKELGVDYFQGWLFSPALSHEDFLDRAILQKELSQKIIVA